ncbi:hypothetical protein A8V01_09145 [Novosphingobium guangzhouense]|uniref:Uncharacterized protein n=1 Tax=Novosphingobium guangzhouense TaxID=1850347 RepID=A0A2K2FUU3_9SPHN|nr:hypothetical protein A8V01_09145 [Novosphingobium guangzhouense]
MFQICSHLEFRKMVRRSTPQQRIDDAAFPIRVKVFAPNKGYGGFGNLLNDMIYWLQDNLPRGDFGQYHGRSPGIRESTGFYFRTLEDAQRFLAAFPSLELADGVSSSSYTSPALPSGGAPRSFGAEPSG